MSDRDVTLSIVMPCFNEEEGVDHLASNIKGLEGMLDGSHELVFVDDGSSDLTYEKLSNIYKDRIGKDVKVVRHPENKGLGAAIRTGFSSSTGKYIAVIDSDCSYDLAYIARMFEIARQEKVDIIVASPYHPEGSTENLPAYRLFFSRNLSRLYNLVVGAKVYTYTSMFRVYSAEVVKKVQFKSDGFLSVAEIFVKAYKQGFQVREYPTVLTERKYGTSNAKIFKMIREHLLFIAKLIFQKEES